MDSTEGDPGGNRSKSDVALPCRTCKELGGPDSKEPRAQAARLTGKGGRVVAAQANACAEGRGQYSLVACWRAVCADAKLGRLRLHDLRHTAASQAVMSGENLPLVGKLLGRGRRKLRNYATGVPWQKYRRRAAETRGIQGNCSRSIPSGPRQDTSEGDTVRAGHVIGANAPGSILRGRGAREADRGSHSSKQQDSKVPASFLGDLELHVPTRVVDDDPGVTRVRKVVDDGLGVRNRLAKIPSKDRNGSRPAVRHANKGLLCIRLKALWFVSVNQASTLHHVAHPILAAWVGRQSRPTTLTRRPRATERRETALLDLRSRELLVRRRRRQRADVR